MGFSSVKQTYLLYLVLIPCWRCRWGVLKFISAMQMRVTLGASLGGVRASTEWEHSRHPSPVQKVFVSGFGVLSCSPVDHVPSIGGSGKVHQVPLGWQQMLWGWHPHPLGGPDQKKGKWKRTIILHPCGESSEPFWGRYHYPHRKKLSNLPMATQPVSEGLDFIDSLSKPTSSHPPAIFELTCEDFVLGQSQGQGQSGHPQEVGFLLRGWGLVGASKQQPEDVPILWRSNTESHLWGSPVLSIFEESFG